MAVSKERACTSPLIRSIRLSHNKRQAGNYTAPSIFEPPARVTLTETKREAWSRDRQQWVASIVSEVVGNVENELGRDVGVPVRLQAGLLAKALLALNKRLKEEFTLIVALVGQGS